jgi:hypothetical protein
MTPFVIVIIFFEVYHQKSLEDQINKVVFAVKDVILAWKVVSRFVDLNLSQVGPKLESLCTDLGGLRFCSGASGHADVIEVELDDIIFLMGNVSQAVQSILLDVLIRKDARLKDLLHYDISVVLIGKAPRGIWDTEDESFDGHSRYFNHVLRLLFPDVYYQNLYDFVLDFIGEVRWVEVFAQPTKSL